MQLRRMELRALRPDLWPRPIRVGLYEAAVCILLYLCLAPAPDLPSVNVWDKAEHTIAWLVLTGLGLILSPRRPRAIALFAIVLGGVVEVLQGTMGWGRDADWHDWLGDSLGVAVALLAWALVRRVTRG